MTRRKEGNVLFNDTLNTFYLRLYGIRHMVKDHSDSERGERERDMFYLTMHSTHFIYGYMASDIWLRTILIVRKETRCRHIGYSYQLTARVLLYAPSHRQDSTYHGLCYTRRGALAGTRNSSMGPPHEWSIRRPIAPRANTLTTELHLAPHPMKDRSDDPSHHERTLLPRSYISLPTPWRIDPTTHRTTSESSYHGATSRSPPHEGSIRRPIAPQANALTTELHLAPHPMKDRSDDPSHHERTLLPRSYISLPIPWRIDLTTHRTMSERSYHRATSCSPPHKDRSDEPSHHERTLLPRSLISLPTPWRIDPTTHRTMSERSYHGTTSRSPFHEGSIWQPIAPWANALTTELHLALHPMKDRSDNPSYHERMLLPRNYISLPTPWRINPTTHHTMSKRSYHRATSRSPPHEGSIRWPIAPWANTLTTELHLAPHPMKDRSDDPSHHERTLLPRSYISLPTLWWIDLTTHRTTSERSYHGATSCSPPHEGSIRRPIPPRANTLTTELHLAPHPMMDRSDDPLHHERTFLPRSYILLPTPWRIDPMTHRTMSECSYHGATSRSPSHEGLIRRPIAPRANALTMELHLAPPWRIDPMNHRTTRERSYNEATSRSPSHEGSIRRPIAPWANALTMELHLAPHPMKDRSDDPSHHERPLLPQSYISLPTPWRIDPTTHRTMSECSYHGATSRSPTHEGSIRRPIAPWANALTTELHLAPHSMNDQSDNPSHHERKLLPRSYISLPHEGSIWRPIAPRANALTTELHLTPPWRIDPTTHRTMSDCSYHGATSRSPMKDRSDDPSHHERTLLPQSYISLPTPWRINPMTHHTTNKHSYHGATSRSTMKDRSDDPSHHEQTLLPRSYISLHHEGSIRRPIAPRTNTLTTELHLAPPWRIDPTTHRTMSERSYHDAVSLMLYRGRPRGGDLLAAVDLDLPQDPPPPPVFNRNETVVWLWCQTLIWLSFWWMSYVLTV